MRCCDCGYSCHEKCTENVPKSCTKYKAVTDRTLTNQNANRACGETASVNSSELTILNYSATGRRLLKC